MCSQDDGIDYGENIKKRSGRYFFRRRRFDNKTIQMNIYYSVLNKSITKCVSSLREGFL
jgi:hypothetical protein